MVYTESDAAGKSVSGRFNRQESEERPRFAPGASGPPSRGHWWRWVPSTGSLSRFRRTTTYPAGPLTRTPPPSKRNHLDSLDHLLSRRDRNRRNPIRPAPQAAGASSEPPHMPRITWAQSADNSWWTMGVKLSNDGKPVRAAPYSPVAKYQRIGSTLRLGPKG